MFDENFRDEVRDLLITRVVDAVRGDFDCATSIVEWGQKGIMEMTDAELMEEWETWCQIKNNPTYERMKLYKTDTEFRKEVLDEQRTES